MKELIEILWEFVLQNKLLFSLSFIFVFLVPIKDIVLPLLYNRIVTAINSGDGFIWPLVIVTIVMILLQVLDFLGDIHDTTILPKLQSFVRTKTILTILDKYEDAIEELELGRINTKLVTLPAVVTSLFERCKNFLIPHMLLHVTATCLFFNVDTSLGLIMMVTTIVFYYIVSRAPKQCSAVTNKRDKAFTLLHEEIDDNLRNLFSIYGKNQKEKELNRLEKYNEHYKSLYQKTTLCSFNVRSLTSVVIIGFVIALMLRIETLVKTKMIGTTSLVPIFFISLYIVSSFMTTDDHLKHVIFDLGVITSSADILTKPSTKKKAKRVEDKKVEVDLEHSKNGIGLKDAYFKFPNSDNMILNGVTLHITQGDSVAILGDIGSGKSTILKLLLGYYKPTRGTVYYNDVNYDDIPMKYIREKIGYVPQVPVLFNRTIMENIRYGNSKITREDVERTLRELNLYKEFAKHKDGLDTKVGKNGSVLSGGQRQLVWCLRVLLSNPDVLILDEPTSSIDEKNKILLKNLLARFMKGKTTIMVTHDPAIVSFASKFVIVKNGRIDSIKTKG
jgi:ABC-type multidrug transport system fused ATPase/permease subunit